MGAVMPFLSLATTAAGGIFSAIGSQQQAQANDRKTAAMIGRQRAVYAAGGLDVNTGSPLDIQADTAQMGRLNSLTIRNNAARQAYGYQASANLDTAEAQNYQQAGDTAMLGSLIGTAGSVGSKWSAYQQAGVDPFAVFAFGGGDGTGGSQLIGGGAGQF